MALCVLIAYTYGTTEVPSHRTTLHRSSIPEGFGLAPTGKTINLLRSLFFSDTRYSIMEKDMQTRKSSQNIFTKTRRRRSKHSGVCPFPLMQLAGVTTTGLRAPLEANKGFALLCYCQAKELWSAALFAIDAFSDAGALLKSVFLSAAPQTKRYARYTQNRQKHTSNYQQLIEAAIVILNANYATHCAVEKA